MESRLLKLRPARKVRRVPGKHRNKQQEMVPKRRGWSFRIYHRKVELLIILASGRLHLKRFRPIR